MALGTTAAILLGAGALGAGFVASKQMSKGQKALPGPGDLPPTPTAPKPEASQATAATNVRRKKRAQSQTVFTNPLGVGGQANIARAGLKTKLGQ